MSSIDYGSGGKGGGGKKPGSGPVDYSTSKPAKGAKAPKTDPKKDLVRLAVRLTAVKNPTKFGIAAGSVADQFADLKPKRINRIADRAGLSDQQRKILFGQIATRDQPNGALSGGGLQYADRPAQAVKGFVVKGGKGAVEGITGEKTFSGAETFAAGMGYTPKGAKKWEKELSPWVRGPLNFAVDTAVDPTTYVGLGTPFAAKQAARTAAKIAVGEEAGAVLSPAARDVFARLTKSGFEEGLSDAEKAAVRAGASKKIVRDLRGVRGGVRVLGHTVPGTAGIGSRAGVGDTGFGAVLERTFRPRAGVAQAERAGRLGVGATQDIENVQAIIKGGQNVGQIAEEAVPKQVVRAMRDAGLGRRAARQAARTGEGLDPVRDALDVGGGKAAVESLNPVERSAAEVMDAVRNKDYEALQGVGRLQDSHVDQGEYFPHYKTQGAPGSTSGKFPGRTPGTLSHRSRDLPASVLDDVEKNPVVALGRHAKETAGETSRVKAFSELGKLTDDAGTPLVVPQADGVDAIKAANPDWESVYTEVKAPVSRNVDGKLVTTDEAWLVHKDIAGDMQKVLKAADSGEVRQTVEYLNALWARYATASPGFVSRNVLQGNFFLGAVLGEARDPRIWAKSLGLMKRVEKGTRTLGDPLRYLDPEETALIKGALDNNAIESGFFENLTRQAERSEALIGKGGKVRKALTGSKLSPVSPDFAPIKGISHVNQYLENWSRLSVYANKIKQGFQPEEAAAFARHYLFDYKDLSPAGDFARKFNPFATWTFKSVPLILGELAKNPKRITIPLHLVDAVGEEGARSEGYPIMPGYAQEGGAIVLPKALREVLPGSLGDNPIAFQPDDPVHSVFDTISPLATLAKGLAGKSEPGWERKLGRDVVSSFGLGGVGGVALSAAEAGSGTKFFSGQQVEPGTQVETPGSLVPFFGKHMSWELNNTLSNALPLISKLSAVAPTGEYEKSQQAKRLVSQIAGLGVIPLTPKTTKSEFYRRLRVLQALQQQITTSGGEVPLMEWESK